MSLFEIYEVDVLWGSFWGLLFVLFYEYEDLGVLGQEEAWVGGTVGLNVGVSGRKKE